MNYTEAIQYLLERLPMYQRVGAIAFKKDLTNIQAFAAELGHPEKAFRSVHVAGTNGKGSVSSMLAAVFTAAGYKTGLYTSPHLTSFTERIRINGKPVAEDFVARFVTEHRAFIENLGPSYFETTVAMAFSYFAREQVDIALIEVGLGGRLDSTNIIQPELSVITNIGWDHMDMLGDTLGKIAGEKAGIIKPDTPVIIGESHPEIRPVFEQKASLEKAPLIFAEEVLPTPVSVERNWRKQVLTVEPYGPLELDLTGSYQRKNLRTALAAITTLKEQGWQLSQQAIRKGLSQVKSLTGLRGRMELLQEKPLILTDTAHNENGIREVLNQIFANHTGPVGILLGMVTGKDHAAILRHFPREARYFFAKPDIPRGMEAESLAGLAAEFGLRGMSYPRIADAYAALKAWLPEEGLGFVGGSTFTVAEVIGE